jgi:hypothetical protein
MRTALLGNGNSRILYEPNPNKYDYVIGCNIPWTTVDATVIMDVNVLEKFDTLWKCYISRKAWIECPNKIKDKIVGCVIGLFETVPDYDSAGHAACRKLLELGSTEIDIYGCDSWFTNNTDSYTHQWIDSRSIDMSKNVSVWRARWYDLIAKHSNVKFNFIGETK